jgi:hypothetical protein
MLSEEDFICLQAMAGTLVRCSIWLLSSSSAGIGIRSATKDSKQETGGIEKEGRI